MIYARRLLDAQQLSLYEKIYPPFAAQVTSPALVIYMRDPAENCLERIHDRNRPYEQQIELQFLQSLNSPVILTLTDKCRTYKQVSRLADEINWYLCSENRLDISNK